MNSIVTFLKRLLISISEDITENIEHIIIPNHYFEDTENNVEILSLPVGAVNDCPDICSICLVSYDHPYDIVSVLKCGHVFHTDCVSSWLNQRDTCPLCRQQHYVYKK